MSHNEISIKWTAHAHIDKYSPEQIAWATTRLGYEPDGTELRALFSSPEDGALDVPGNLLTTAGLQRVTNLIIASGAQGLTNTRTAVGVGDRGGSASDTAAVGDTTLTANGSNAYYMTLDGSFPTAVNGVLTCQSTYASGVANFAWNEWCWVITNGAITPGATMASIGTTPQIINHKTPASSMGTKASGASWVFTTTVTLS
ncbi:MAG: hypothetical protein LC723_05775 [Actinobacteria bacterium]|nr:hypothetical protein [Actinomycetota bacterium]